MAGLYEIISDLRRQNQTPAGARTLDLVVAELGQTQDNLREALSRLTDRAIPIGGRPLLQELHELALENGVDDLDQPVAPSERRREYEPVDESQVGIAILLGGSAAIAVLLALVVTVAGLNQILHFL